VGLVLG